MRKDKPLRYILGVITGLLTASLCTACGGVTDTDNDNGLGHVSGISGQQYKADKLNFGKNPPVKGPKKGKPSPVEKPSKKGNPDKKKPDKKKPDKINLKSKPGVTKLGEGQTKQDNTNLKKDIHKPTVGIITPPREIDKNDPSKLINPLQPVQPEPSVPEKPVNKQPDKTDNVNTGNTGNSSDEKKPSDTGQDNQKKGDKLKDDKTTDTDKSGIDKQFNDDEEVQQINGQ